jgi:SAF domain
MRGADGNEQRWLGAALSTQERIEIQARNGRPEQAPLRPTGPGTSTDRLPRPPGRRRPGLAVIAVLLIVLGAAVAGLLAMRIDDRVPVLVAGHEIGIGQQIRKSDLAIAEVASSGLAVIRADQLSEVVGRYAATTIPPGRLVDPQMLSSSGLLVDGKAAVGVSLQQGRYPASGLKSGDVVDIVNSKDGDGKVIAERAVVGTVATPGDSVFGSGSSTNTVITVVVDQPDAASVAAASAAQQVSVVLLRRGGTVGGG